MSNLNRSTWRWNLQPKPLPIHPEFKDYWKQKSRELPRLNEGKSMEAAKEKQRKPKMNEEVLHFGRSCRITYIWPEGDVNLTAFKGAPFNAKHVDVSDLVFADDNGNFPHDDSEAKVETKEVEMVVVEPPQQRRPQPAPKTPDMFDYSQLSIEDQVAIRVQTSAIRGVLKRTAEGILQIGESLADVQSRLANHHQGTFQEWIKAEFGWSQRTAYNFISVYERFGSRANFAQLDIAASALYLLAEPSTSEEVVDTIIDRAESGEPIKHSDVKEAKEAAAIDQDDEHESSLKAESSESSTREETPAAMENAASVDSPSEPTKQEPPAPEAESASTSTPQGRHKPKENRTSDEESPLFDRCQTPSYGLVPLIPYLHKDWHVWEAAAGKGRLVEALLPHVAKVSASDVLNGEDFFTSTRTDFDVIITNPPYSTKYDWLKHCYELGKPFALLIPGESLFAASGAVLFDKYGVELVIPTPRIDFDMPNLGFNGDGATFPTAWFTWGFNIGKLLTYVDISAEKKAFKDGLKSGAIQ